MNDEGLIKARRFATISGIPYDKIRLVTTKKKNKILISRVLYKRDPTEFGLGYPSVSIDWYIIENVLTALAGVSRSLKQGGTLHIDLPDDLNTLSKAQIDSPEPLSSDSSPNNERLTEKNDADDECEHPAQYSYTQDGRKWGFCLDCGREWEAK